MNRNLKLGLVLLLAVFLMSCGKKKNVEKVVKREEKKEEVTKIVSSNNNIEHAKKLLKEIRDNKENAKEVVEDLNKVDLDVSVEEVGETIEKLADDNK